LKWTRAIETTPGKYDFAALVTNKNISNAPHGITYTFSVYDDSGNVIKTITGSTTVPIDGDFPIIQQKILLDQPPKDVGITFSKEAHFAVKELSTSPTIRIINTRYESGAIPRVYATVINTKRIAISKLPIRVVLYDASGNAMGVGQTVI